MYSIRFHQIDTKPILPIISPQKKLEILEQVIIPSLKKKLQEAESEAQLLKRNN